MGLRDDVAADSVGKGITSYFFQILEELPAEERGEFLELMADRSVVAPKIARALRARGFQVSDHNVGEWRRKGYHLAG